MVRLPVAAITHRKPGLTVLVCGGTHGDEFEGQLAAAWLSDELEMAIECGRLIVLPAHHPPAVATGSRCSPIDGRDLNRAYDDPQGEGPTDAIARFVLHNILPLCDVVLDLHSGGRGHEFLLSANLQAQPDSAEEGAMREILLAFGAPWALIFDDNGTGSMPHGGTLEAAARRLGIPALSSELGGGGRVTPASVAVAKRGIRNVLAAIGLASEPASPPTPAERVLLLDRADQQILAPRDGVFVPTCRLGDPVRAGQELGLFYPGEDILAAKAVPVFANADGVVLARAAFARCMAGDVILMIARQATE